MNKKHDIEKVIEIGLHLFCSRGYNNVGIDEICKATGMTKGAFYNSFESKEAFLLATIDSFDKSNTARINNELRLEKKIKAIDKLKQFYFTMLEFQPNVNYMGCMVNNMMSELGALNENVALATKKGFESIINAVEPTVKQAQKEGDLNSEYNSLELATLFHSTFYGVLTRAKSLGNYKNGMKTMNLLFDNLKTQK